MRHNFLKTVLIIIFSFAPILIKAQDTTYFSSDMKVTDKSNATLYRVTQKIAEGFSVKEYAMNSVLLNLTQYKSIEPSIKNGHAITFYANGKVREMGFYNINKKDSVWTKYDENNNIVSQLVYYNDFILKFLKVEPVNADSVLTQGEKMPEFPGGEVALMQYLKDNIRYPDDAERKKISGRVYVNFIVMKDGTISDPKILKGIGYGCDEEVLRVVSKMPAWKPGMHGGQPVNVSFNMPVYFNNN